MPVPTSTSLSLSRHSSACDSKFPASPGSSKTSAVYTNCLLPAELLEIIVSYAYKPECSFSSVSGFASASYAFRQVALRCVCTHLNIHCPKRWSSGMPNIKDLAKWVRTLCGAAQALAVPEAVKLRSFHLLRTVRVNFLTETIANHRRTIFPLLDALPAGLTDLSFTDLPDISVRMLCAIADKFLLLRSLELSCIDRLDPSCCWSCFDESASCVWHSPIPDVFTSVQDMTIKLRRILSPLTNLEHLQLGFFLSPEDLFYEHLEHAQEFVESEERPFGPEWCLLCFERHAANVRLAELQASLAFAQTLRALRTLTLGSFFGRQGREMKSRRTNIWVFRKDGKIRVRRKPW
ncbi:hypothetical protein M0805_005118 [Coniferiporia weirii]|nr:hypothetical protein M0805_005118 [Coniferiporia weirii]